MKKKLLISVLCIVLCLTLGLALVACNENYKQDAVPTDLNGARITSNGGSAVVVGKYLYFINGYAGADVDNAFGNVVKGAVMRVELKDGTPDRSTLTTIVPKNVYNTNADCGLVVSGDYIYYSTTSIDKDSTGAAKTSEMWIMRTKLDGTGTEVIAEFHEFGCVIYRVAGDFLYYFDEDEAEIHAIDLTSKKFKDTLVDEKVTSYLFADYADNANELANVAFYTKAPEDGTTTHNVVWAVRNGEKKAVIDGLTSYPANTLPHPAGYTFTLLDVYFDANVAKLVYSKSDSGTNAVSKGDYLYEFTADLAFDASKEERLTGGATYTAMNFFDGNNIMAVDSDSVDYLSKVDGKWTSVEVIKASSASVLSVDVNDGRVTVYYIVSKVLYRIDVLSKDGNVYKVERNSAVTVYSDGVATDWIGMDRAGNLVCFFNSNVKNNIYYLDLTKVEERNTNTMIASQLGKFSAEDNVGMLASADK